MRGDSSKDAILKNVLRDRNLGRRDLLKVGGGAAAAMASARFLPQRAFAQASDLPYTANTSLSGKITFWHFWGSPLRRTAVRRIVAEFNVLYPDIEVEETFVPFSDIWNKNLAAVAAGKDMPDVIVEDRPLLPDRAKNEIETNLGDLATRDGVTGDAFWPFTWQQATVDGQPYGLPYETDIRVLYYNKAAFMDAGLDPNTPPKDWDELATFADKLDLKDGDELQRIGFFPTFGNIGLDQWAWNNGGDWQDADLNPTFNRPENVATLEWMKTWADRYGFENVQALQSTFGSGTEDGFMSGKVAMIVDIQGYTSQLNFYNAQFKPKDSEENAGYGVAPITPAPGHEPAALSGGFALSIPRGAENVDPAWEFIKYATFVGQLSWARDTYAVPTVQAMKDDPVLSAAPNWSFIVDAMNYGRAGLFNQYYPSMIADLIPAATQQALSGEKTPQEALDEAQDKAEEEVNRNRS